MSVKMSSFPERWCGYLCPFGENDATGRMSDWRVVGGQITQQVVRVRLKNKYCLCNRSHPQAALSPAKTTFSQTWGFCMFWAWLKLRSHMCVGHMVNSSQNQPAGEGQTDSGVLICQMGAVSVPFTDVCGGDKTRSLPAAK